MKSAEEKRIFEQAVLAKMIGLYCRKNHQGKEMCAECKELLEYAQSRSDLCPNIEEKTFCINCSTHCYKPAMREKIRVAMRFSGPRMIFYHPLLALKHMRESSKEKKAQKAQESADNEE